MDELTFYKDRCTKLQDLVERLSHKLWGADTALAKDVADILSESYTDHVFEEQVNKSEEKPRIEQKVDILNTDIGI